MSNAHSHTDIVTYAGISTESGGIKDTYQHSLINMCSTPIVTEVLSHTHSLCNVGQVTDSWLHLIKC